MDMLHEMFRENVRRRIHELGFTQTEVARRLGCSDAHVSQILSGRCVPTLDSVERIAAVLEIAPHALLEPVPEKIPA